MDFLKSLYSNDNFGMYLFIAISILVLAFLIILFFGKKDQKERKLAETNNSINITNNENKIESPKSELAFEDQAPSMKLEFSDTTNNLNKPFIEEQQAPFPTMESVPEPIIPPMEPPKMEEPVPMMSDFHEPPKTDFDFDALAASISKELESIGIDTSEKEEEIPLDATITLPPLHIDPIPPINEPDPVVAPENPIMFETPTMETPNVEMRIEKESVKAPEEKITKPSKTQFSSVFVNKKSEDSSELPKEEIKEEPKIIPEPTPVKPTIELPKTIDLPKLNKDPEPKAKVLDDDIPHIIFPSLENDIPKDIEDDKNRM